jgi:hypothetical protein
MSEKAIEYCKHGGWIGWCVRCKDEELAALKREAEFKDKHWRAMEDKIAALKEENQRLHQELYNMENDEAWRLESLASDERIRDE